MRKTIFLGAVVGLVILVGTGCTNQLDNKDQNTNQPAVNQPTNEVNNGNQDITTPSNSYAGWQEYSDSKYSYKCPADWTLGKNKNYNGQVELSECSKIYAEGMAFDDGVSITFGFVPETVADNDILDGVKNEANAQSYSNNSFVGWLSMENEKHALEMIARYQVNDGYYEISANAAGTTKTDAEFKTMIDEIVATFKTK